MSLYGKFNPRRAFSLVEAFDLDEAGDVASFWVESDELANAFRRMHIDMMDDASDWVPEDVDRQSAMSAVRRLRKIADKLEGIANVGAKQPSPPGVAFGNNLNDPNEPAWVNGELRIRANEEREMSDINWQPIDKWVSKGSDDERLVYVGVFSKKTGQVSSEYYLAKSSDSHVWIGDCGDPFKRLGDIYVRDSPFVFERMTHFASLEEPGGDNV